MSGPIKIPLSESQKTLLQSKELTTYLEPEIKLALLAIESKGEPYTLNMDPMDLENLIEMICNVANHEMINSKLGKQFGQLSGYLEKYLDEEWPMRDPIKIQFEITEAQREPKSMELSSPTTKTEIALAFGMKADSSKFETWIKDKLVQVNRQLWQVRMEKLAENERTILIDHLKKL